MRDIKFRAKRKDIGEWIYGGYHKHTKRQASPIGDNLTDEDFVHLIIRSGFADWNMPRPLEAIEIEPDTLSQYTRLKDKNDVEIYEGDIISVNNRIGFKAKVSFTNGAFYQTPQGQGFASARTLYNHIYKSKDYEVLGNIYENPELLEGDD